MDFMINMEENKEVLAKGGMNFFFAFYIGNGEKGVHTFPVFPKDYSY